MKTLAALLIVGATTAAPSFAADKLKLLIVDGQNNHGWRSTTPVLKTILEKTGRFEVSVSTSPTNKSPKAAWASFRPAFKDFAVVLSNYNGEEWPDEVKGAFLDYMKNGGGLVIYHAADNSFPQWKEYNEMIGVGGWGGRNEKSGPKLHWQDGKIVRDTSPGGGGHHGPQHEFLVETRDADHPVMKGLPAKWLQPKDELYDSLRGPAENITVLATAFSDPQFKGTGRHEPQLMTIVWNKGRIFHTALGHGAEQLQGLGFQITLVRGCEWAATGNVTIPAPAAGELTADRVAIVK